jgi:hypothetical protein
MTYYLKYLFTMLVFYFITVILNNSPSYVFIVVKTIIMMHILAHDLFFKMAEILDIMVQNKVF